MDTEGTIYADENPPMELRVRLDEILASNEAARTLPQALDRLDSGEAAHLVITRRNDPRAVLITVERYEELLRAEAIVTGQPFNLENLRAHLPSKSFAAAFVGAIQNAESEQEAAERISAAVDERLRKLSRMASLGHWVRVSVDELGALLDVAEAAQRKLEADGSMGVYDAILNIQARTDLAAALARFTREES